MKKLIIVLTIVLSVVCFCGCTKTPTASVAPSTAPSTEQSVEQSVAPTLAPSEELTPTTAPSVEPSETPTIEPTVAPSEEPTPSVEITVEPTVVPSIEPTVAPTDTPTVQPTVTPSEPPVDPTVAPSVEDPSDIYFDRPADTNLEFWITEDVSDINFYGNYAPGDDLFGIVLYCGMGYTRDMTEKVVYGLTPYPDHADRNLYITRIEITDPNITIYGLTINSDWETVKQVLTEQGFTIIEKTLIIAQKGRLTIYFEKNRILMFVEVTNNQGIIF